MHWIKWWMVYYLFSAILMPELIFIVRWSSINYVSEFKSNASILLQTNSVEKQFAKGKHVCLGINESIEILSLNWDSLIIWIYHYIFSHIIPNIWECKHHSSQLFSYKTTRQVWFYWKLFTWHYPPNSTPLKLNKQNVNTRSKYHCKTLFRCWP